MKRLMFFLLLGIIGLCMVTCAQAEEICGIYASVDRPLENVMVIHPSGWMEVYGDARDLPDNSISLGYISMRTTYEITDQGIVTADGTEIRFSPQPLWQDRIYAKQETSPFFPTASQLGTSGLVWENDQIGSLMFEEDGTVHSDICADGLYDNGLLNIGGRSFIVQRSVWSDDEKEGFILCDQTLTLYEIENGESIDRLLLVEDGEILVLE